MTEMASADCGHRPPKKGGRIPLGRWLAAGSVLPNPPPAGKAIVRGTPGEQNVPNLRDRLPESFEKTGYATHASAVFGGVGLMSMRRIAFLATGFLLVQEGDNPPFRITCTIESRYSRCTPLTKGATFEARREKKGITVYFVDDKGKARSQLYKLVDTGGKAGPTAAPVTVAAQPVPASPESAGRAPAAAVAAPRQGSPASAPVVQTAP